MVDEMNIESKENEKGGEIARKGMLRQDLYLIESLIKSFRDGNFICAYCEHHEDYLLVSKSYIDIVQVKTKNDDSEDWSNDSNFRKAVLYKFYETNQKIQSNKAKRFYFITNCSLKKKLQDIFKILRKDPNECDESDQAKLTKFIDQSMTSLKKLNPDREILTRIIKNLKFKRKAEIDVGLKSNKYLIQEILKPAKVDLDIAERVHSQLVNLVVLASSASTDLELNTFSKIENNSELSDSEKESEINQLKKCITRKKVLDSINFEDSPFDTEILYKYPENIMKFQREMLKAKIPQPMVKVAGMEFFNIEYHRKRIEELLSGLGKKYLDSSKAQVLSMWSDSYLNKMSEEEKFGLEVYKDSRNKINNSVEHKELTSPVLHKKIHAFGLLHELAEEEEVRYTKE